EGRSLSAPRRVVRTARPSPRRAGIGLELAANCATHCWRVAFIEKRHMHWESVLKQPTFDLRRSGRFLVADLNGAHRVLSTSVRNGGQVDHVRYLLNHQSCEGAAHLERHRMMTEDGLDAYHDKVCAEVALAPDVTALMGTAANMN